MTDSTITPHTALVYLMVLISASDSNMTDSELKKMGDIVKTAAPFEGYDPEKLVTDAENCAEILGDDEGFDAVLGLIHAALPESHYDTAYALACEVAVADAHLSQEELRVLEMIRYQFGVDRLTAAAIERGSTARNRPL
jgi:tellurite resistance protein